MKNLAATIINAIVNAILLIILFTNLIYFCKREHKFERGFKLIFVTLSVGLLCKNVYCGIVFYIDWSKHTEDNLKFVAWNLTSLSYLLIMYSFQMLIAKVFSLVFALARHKLSKAITLIKKTNAWIFWIGIILSSGIMAEVLIAVIVFLS